MNSDCQLSESDQLRHLKEKKYWSGNIRIISDIMWCIAISVLIALSSRAETYMEPESYAEYFCRYFGRIVGCFFTFFFWSWNREHLKCRVARIAIHFLCWTMFIIGLCTLVFLGWYFPRSLSEYTGWYVLILTTVWGMLIARKYKAIMWPKKSSEYQTN